MLDGKEQDAHPWTPAAQLSCKCHLQAAVRAVRNARAEYGVEPGRKVAATLAVASAELRAALESEADVLALLAKLEREQVGREG